MIKKSCIITGGAGFIGSHMADLLLKKNYKVIVLDNLKGGYINNIKHNLKNKDFRFIKKDILKIKKKDRIFRNIEYVFHFAGIGDLVPSIEKPVDYINANAMGTLKVLEASRNAKIKKFVYAASSSCYGLAKTPTKEINKIDPQYPYALSKYIGEEICLHWSKVYKLPVNSIRIFNAYGPRVRTTGAYGAVFGVFFRQKLAGKPFTVVGDGKQERDFVYVTDVCEAFYKAALTKHTGQIFNLGGGSPQSVNKLINIIGGKKINIKKRPGEPNKTHSDNTKIRKLLKWYPKINFTHGVKTMMKDIQNWKDAPLWNKSKINIATKTWFKYLGK